MRGGRCACALTTACSSRASRRRPRRRRLYGMSSAAPLSASGNSGAPAAATPPSSRTPATPPMPRRAKISTALDSLRWRLAASNESVEFGGATVAATAAEPVVVGEWSSPRRAPPFWGRRRLGGASTGAWSLRPKAGTEPGMPPPLDPGAPECACSASATARERVAQRAAARGARGARGGGGRSPSLRNPRRRAARRGGCRRRPTTTRAGSPRTASCTTARRRGMLPPTVSARASTLNASQHEFYLAGPRPDHPREIVEGDTVLVSYRRDGAHFAGLEIGGVRFVPRAGARRHPRVPRAARRDGRGGDGRRRRPRRRDGGRGRRRLERECAARPRRDRRAAARARADAPTATGAVDGRWNAAGSGVYLDGASLWNASSEWADRYMEEHEWLRLRSSSPPTVPSSSRSGTRCARWRGCPLTCAPPPAARGAAPPSSRPRSRAATSIASAPSVASAARRPTRRCRLMSPPTAGTWPLTAPRAPPSTAPPTSRSDVRQPDAAPHQLFVLRAGDALVGVAGGGARRRRRAPPRARRTASAAARRTRLQLVVARRVGGGDVERGGGRRRVPRAQQLGRERDGRAPPLAQRPAADGRRARLPVRQPAHLVVRTECGAGGGRHRPRDRAFPSSRRASRRSTRGMTVSAAISAASSRRRRGTRSARSSSVRRRARRRRAAAPSRSTSLSTVRR